MWLFVCDISKKDPIMEFLELFDFGERKRRKHNEIFGQGDHHDDDDDADDEHHQHRSQNPANAYPQILANPAAAPTGIVCRRCSTQTVQGAKFCHGCGNPIEMISNCASCGSKLPDNAPYCLQCGYGNG
jgi:ribosomal protein L40E